MSYVINNSRGQLIAVVPEGTVNTTNTSLSLVGQGVLNYGTAEIENYVFLLENFASPTSPEPPLLGQLWYDSSSDTMKVWTSGNVWVGLVGEAYVQAQKISPAFTGVPTAPTANVGTATTQIATTAFVTNSPQFAGVPTAPTAAASSSNTQIATTAFVTSAISNFSANIANDLGTMAVQNSNAVAITGGTITGITDIAIADGGTGASTAADARTNLGLGTISTQNANAVAITGGTVTGITDIAIGDGGTGASTAADARTNLGLGTMAVQNANAVAITGGTITGVTISNSIGLVPAGVIVMWSGSVASIPATWALCNGSNGTPDLRDRFVIGAGMSYGVGSFGGSKDQAVVAHTHTASSVVNDPGHLHGFTVIAQNTDGRGSGALTGGTLNYGNDGSYTGTTTTAVTGVSVTTTVNSTGSSGLNANLPPYFALCYIMKL